MPYLIYAAIAALGTLISKALFFIVTSVIAKSTIGLLIAIGISYFAVTKLEAFKLISGYITNLLNSTGSSGIAGQTINIPALGQLIQLLRIEDIILVYLSAMITAYLIRILISIISIAKVFT